MEAPKATARLTWQRALPYVLVIGGIIGLIASATLTYDKIHVLADPNYQPGCNLNPVLSCGSVMKTAQASLFGVPNSVFGVLCFSALTVFGLLLIHGRTFKRRFWLIAQAVATVGVIFMHYLFFQAVFRIHAICPWCFVVWMVTIPIFFGITIYNIRHHYLGASHFTTFISKYSTDILVLWYVLILGTLLVKFWYYWSTLL